jgi:hypothetical protein
MPGSQVDRATDHSIILVLMPVSRSRNGAGKDGYIPPIRAAGSNGTAATTWGDECSKRTLARSNVGKQFAVTCVSFNFRASPVICGVADGNGRRYSIGPTTAANSDRQHGRMMEPSSSSHRGELKHTVSDHCSSTSMRAAAWATSSHCVPQCRGRGFVNQADRCHAKPCRSDLQSTSRNGMTFGATPPRL